MAKDPAILFYTSDFLTGTFTMNDEQVGRYIKLLCLQHQKGNLSEKDMLFVCKGNDEEVFSKFEKDEKGNFFNKTLKEKAEERKKYSESRSKNRSKRKDMSMICFTYDEHMENVIENVNEINIENINVLLTEREFEKLKIDFGEEVIAGSIKLLLDYGNNKPKKFSEYQNHNLTLRNWVITSYKEKFEKNGSAKLTNYENNANAYDSLK